MCIFPLPVLDSVLQSFLLQRGRVLYSLICSLTNWECFRSKPTSVAQMLLSRRTALKLWWRGDAEVTLPLISRQQAGLNSFKETVAIPDLIMYSYFIELWPSEKLGAEGSGGAWGCAEINQLKFSTSQPSEMILLPHLCSILFFLYFFIPFVGWQFSLILPVIFCFPHEPFRKLGW